MNGHATDIIRNVALLSYPGAGKTSLTEALLFTTGILPTMGTVAHATTVSDFEPEEHHRQFSVHTSVLHYQWNHISGNVLDTPGSASFIGETKAALRAVDGVILLVDVMTGLKPELEKLWAFTRELHLPSLLFLNGIDHDGADWNKAFHEIEEGLALPGIPITIPYAPDGPVVGVLDLLAKQVVTSGPKSPKVCREAVRDEDLSPITEVRRMFVEGVAEQSEVLLEKYVREGDLTRDDLLVGLRRGTHSGDLVPVLCGSAIHAIGVASLLDAVTTFLPSSRESRELGLFSSVEKRGQLAEGAADTVPEPFSGFVFKTMIDPFVGRLNFVRVITGSLRADSVLFNATRQVKEKGGHLFTICGKKYSQVQEAHSGDIVAIGKLKETQTGDSLCEERAFMLYPPLDVPKPVFSFAIEAQSNGDIEKVSLGLHKLVEEDPTLQFIRNPETKEMIVSGLGQLHIDLTLERLRRKYGAEVVVHTPKVPYKETIRMKAEAQGKHKKQTGGHGQYGDCWLKLEPLSRGEGWKFNNKIVGGAIPRNFIPAVEKGVQEAMRAGCVAGFPVVDVQVTVYDGSFHAVDSSEMAFKIAASLAFKKAMELAHGMLLEPIMLLEVVTPDHDVGSVIGDLNSKRGRILGVTAKGHLEMIQVHLPLVEALRYTTSLHAHTGGRGTFTMEFDHYDEVPHDLVGKIVEEQQGAKRVGVS